MCLNGIGSSSRRANKPNMPHLNNKEKEECGQGVAQRCVAWMFTTEGFYSKLLSSRVTVMLLRMQTKNSFIQIQGSVVETFIF